MEKGSPGLQIFRLVFGVLFTVFGIWMSAKIVLQLQGVNAPWPDWLALLFPAVPLAVGILSLVVAVHNPPAGRRPFLRHRRGPARIFGGIFGAVTFFAVLITHLFRQNSLSGVMRELVVASAAAGVLALLYGVINADLPDRDQHSGQ
jgi:hypothetical protein